MLMRRAVTSLVFAGALLAIVSAQPATRRVFVEVTRPSGAPEVDLRADDFEVTEAGSRLEIVSARMAHRPLRLLLVADSTQAITEPNRLVRTALIRFINAVDPQIEMMLVTVGGTPQLRVPPTLERQAIVKSVADIFSRGGTLHAIRLTTPTGEQAFREGHFTELHATSTSPDGLLEVMAQLATVVNAAYRSSTPGYEIEFAGPPAKGTPPAAPHVRVLRDGLSVNVISTR
jgi:hypothetical protein